MCTVNSVEDVWRIRSHELSSVLCEAGTLFGEGGAKRVVRVMPAVPKEVAETGLQQLESWKHVQHQKQVSMCTLSAHVVC